MMKKTIIAEIIIQVPSKEKFTEEVESNIILQVEQNLNIIGVISVDVEGFRELPVGVRFHFIGVKP